MAAYEPPDLLESKACGTCHGVGFHFIGKPGSFEGQGVKCGSCHGSGRIYKHVPLAPAEERKTFTMGKK